MAQLVPLMAAIGMRVRCPDCGAIAIVEKSRAAAAPAGGLPPPPGTAPAARAVVPSVPIVIVRCPRATAKVFRGDMLAEVVIDG